MHNHYTVEHGLPLCLTNLLECFEQVKHMDKEDIIGIVYLDFPKAFDKVPHPRFFKELNCHGRGRKVLTWINTWMKDRKQGMNMRFKCGEQRKPTSGIRRDMCWEAG